MEKYSYDDIKKEVKKLYDDITFVKIKLEHRGNYTVLSMMVSFLAVMLILTMVLNAVFFEHQIVTYAMCGFLLLATIPGIFANQINAFRSKSKTGSVYVLRCKDYSYRIWAKETTSGLVIRAIELLNTHKLLYIKENSYEISHEDWDKERNGFKDITGMHQFVTSPDNAFYGIRMRYAVSFLKLKSNNRRNT